MDLPSPTRTTAPTEDTKPSQPDRTRNTADAKPEKTETRPSSKPSAEAEGATTTTQAPAEEAGTPSWVWWVLAAILVAVLAGVAAAWARARRRKRWSEDFRAAEDEVGWFAHTLVPELRRSASLDQVVGGWKIASTRVGALEDRLTVLGATAPSEAEQSRARTLRDAARLAHQRLDSLTVVAPHDTWALDLDDVAADLEVALGTTASPASGPA